MKRKLCCGLIICVLAVGMVVVTGMASESEIAAVKGNAPVWYCNETADDAEEKIEIRKQGEDLRYPENSYLPVEGVPITNMGAYWIQTGTPTKCDPSYRVWITNNTNQTMLVVIRYFPEAVNSPEGKENTFTVEPKMAVAVSVNNAVPGYHFISTDTQTGEFDGMIRVRASEAEL